MKQTLLVILAISLICFSACTKSPKFADTQESAAQVPPVNQVLGDISFETRFGYAPDASIDENLRLKTHLQYVEQTLRKREIQHLSPELQANRKKLLDHLQAYHQAGAFPHNYDHPGERKPCFIDRDGNICAVGYLIEQSAGRALSEKINDQFQYASVFDMEMPELTDWVAMSGLTLEECAMIQPAYWGPDLPEPGYGVATAVWSGGNASLVAFNTAQIGKRPGTLTVPVVGILSGAGQLAMGSYRFRQENKSRNGLGSARKGEVNASLLNIGVGTATMLISSYNLLSNWEGKKERTTGVNLFSYPTSENQLAVGLGVSKKF